MFTGPCRPRTIAVHEVAEARVRIHLHAQDADPDLLRQTVQAEEIRSEAGQGKSKLLLNILFKLTNKDYAELSLIVSCGRFFVAGKILQG